MNQQEKIPEVGNILLYNNMQIFFMKIYLDVCRRNGDNRNKNEILSEWIKDHSEEFRCEWCRFQDD